jgi:O-antigen ligase
MEEKKYEIIDRVIESGIYLFIVFMFLSKGEGIRNILIFGNFILWLFTIKHRKNLYILKQPISVLFWLFLGVTLFSVIFSMDPVYSFLELRGDPLKAALLFPVISTVMISEQRLKRLVFVCFLTTALILSIGFYSYFSHDIPALKADTILMHTGSIGYNRFVIFLNTILPFAFIPALLSNKPRGKALLGILIFISLIALLLTASRMGLLAFFCILLTWSLYFAKKRNISPIKIIASITVTLCILITISWFSFPYTKNRFFSTFEELQTVNLRTQAWKPAIYAFLQRPIFGWGYGDQIFFQDEPFQNTFYRKAPDIFPKNLHNVFIKILFHQGIVSLIIYCFLILYAIKYFWKSSFLFNNIRSYVSIASVSVLVSNYIVHSMTEEVPNLRFLSVIIGIGIVAQFINENSNT